MLTHDTVPVGMLPASLKLDFQNQDYRLGLNKKAFSDIITFTRASGGGRFNENGKYEWVGNDVPRINYDPVTGECKGLLIEESRTNLVTYSEQFESTAWSSNAAGISVTSNAIVAPDGTTTADKLVEDIYSNHHRRGHAITSSTVDRRFSVYLKAGERTLARMWSWAGGSTTNAYFDLSAGTAGGQNSPKIENVGNGWYRCSCTVDAENSTSVVFGPVISGYETSTNAYTGDGVSGIYSWGAQLEEGAFETSYIPTTTAAVTRAGDVAKITPLQWLDEFEGTFSANFRGGLESSQGGYGRVIGVGSYKAVMSRNNGSSLVSWDGNTATITSLLSDSKDNFTKAALAYNENKTIKTICGNGGTPVSGSYSKFDFANGICIGRGGSLDRNYLNGHIKNIEYYPYAMSDAQLQSLTS